MNASAIAADMPRLCADLSAYDLAQVALDEARIVAG